MRLQAVDLGAAVPGARAGVRAAGTVRITGLVRVLFALLMLGQLGRIPLLSVGGKEAPLMSSDLMVAVIAAAALVASLRARRLRMDATALFALAFAGIGALSAVLAVPRFGLTGFELAFSLAYLVRWLVYFTLYVAVLNFVPRAEGTAVFRSFLNAVLVFAAFGIFQAAFLPGFAQLIYPQSVEERDWDAQGHRLVSTLLDPNYAGAVLNIGILPSMALLAYGAKIERWRILVLGLALLLTASRGAVLSCIVGMVVVVAARGLSRRMLRLVGAGLLLLVPLLPVLVAYAIRFNKYYIDPSAMTRVAGWLQGAELLMAHPVLGVGFNTYGFVVQRVFKVDGGLQRSSFGVDGGLLMIAALTGVVGLALYSGMLWTVVARCRRIWRNDAATLEERGLALGTAAVTVGFVFHGFFLNTLMYPFLVQPIWVLWALTRASHTPPGAPPNG